MLEHKFMKEAIKEAREEGFEDIANFFRNLIQVETCHQSSIPTTRPTVAVSCTPHGRSTTAACCVLRFVPTGSSATWSAPSSGRWSTSAAGVIRPTGSGPSSKAATSRGRVPGLPRRGCSSATSATLPRFFQGCAPRNIRSDSLSAAIKKAEARASAFLFVCPVGYSSSGSMISWVRRST